MTEAGFADPVRRRARRDSRPVRHGSANAAFRNPDAADRPRGPSGGGARKPGLRDPARPSSRRGAACGGRGPAGRRIATARHAARRAVLRGRAPEDRGRLSARRRIAARRPFRQPRRHGADQQVELRPDRSGRQGHQTRVEAERDDAVRRREQAAGEQPAIGCREVRAQRLQGRLDAAEEAGLLGDVPIRRAPSVGGLVLEQGAPTPAVVLRESEVGAPEATSSSAAAAAARPAGSGPSAASNRPSVRRFTSRISASRSGNTV